MFKFIYIYMLISMFKIYLGRTYIVEIEEQIGQCLSLKCQDEKEGILDNDTYCFSINDI